MEFIENNKENFLSPQVAIQKKTLPPTVPNTHRPQIDTQQKLQQQQQQQYPNSVKNSNQQLRENFIRSKQNKTRNQSASQDNCLAFSQHIKAVTTPVKQLRKYSQEKNKPSNIQQSQGQSNIYPEWWSPSQNDQQSQNHSSSKKTSARKYNNTELTLKVTESPAPKINSQPAQPNYNRKINRNQESQQFSLRDQTSENTEEDQQNNNYQKNQYNYQQFQQKPNQNKQIQKWNSLPNSQQNTQNSGQKNEKNIYIKRRQLDDSNIKSILFEPSELSNQNQNQRQQKNNTRNAHSQSSERKNHFTHQNSQYLYNNFTQEEQQQGLNKYFDQQPVQIQSKNNIFKNQNIQQQSNSKFQQSLTEETAKFQQDDLNYPQNQNYQQEFDSNLLFSSSKKGNFEQSENQFYPPQFRNQEEFQKFQDQQLRENQLLEQHQSQVEKDRQFYLQQQQLLKQQQEQQQQQIRHKEFMIQEQQKQQEAKKLEQERKKRYKKEIEDINENLQKEKFSPEKNENNLHLAKNKNKKISQNQSNPNLNKNQDIMTASQFLQQQQLKKQQQNLQKQQFIEQQEKELNQNLLNQHGYQQQQNYVPDSSRGQQQKTVKNLHKNNALKVQPCNRRKPTHHQDTLSNKKVTPKYLQNVQSKIKDQIQQSKQMFKHKNEEQIQILESEKNIYNQQNSPDKNQQSIPPNQYEIQKKIQDENEKYMRYLDQRAEMQHEQMKKLGIQVEENQKNQNLQDDDQYQMQFYKSITSEFNPKHRNSDIYQEYLEKQLMSSNDSTNFYNSRQFQNINQNQNYNNNNQQQNQFQNPNKFAPNHPSNIYQRGFSSDSGFDNSNNYNFNKDLSSESEFGYAYSRNISDKKYHNQYYQQQNNTQNNQFKNPQQMNDYTQNEYNIFKKQNLFPYSKGRTVSGISPIPTQLQSPMTSNTKINSPSKPQHQYQQSEFNHPIQSQDDMFYQKKKKTFTMDFDNYQQQPLSNTLGNKNYLQLQQLEQLQQNKLQSQSGENFYNHQKNNEKQSQQVKNQGKPGNLLDIANTFLNSPLMQQISQIDSNQSESASKNFNKQNLLQNYEPYSSSKKANDNLNDESVFSQFNSRIQEEMRSLFMKEQEEEKKINENNQKNKTTFKSNPQEQIQEIDSHKEHDNLHKNDEQEYNTEEQIQNYQQQQEQYLLQQQLKHNQLKQQQDEDENTSKNEDHEQQQQLNQNLDNQEQIQNQWNNKEYPQERNYSFNKKEFQ